MSACRIGFESRLAWAAFLCSAVLLSEYIWRAMVNRIARKCSIRTTQLQGECGSPATRLNMAAPGSGTSANLFLRWVKRGRVGGCQAPHRCAQTPITSSSATRARNSSPRPSIKNLGAPQTGKTALKRLINHKIHPTPPLGPPPTRVTAAMRTLWVVSLTPA